jgi:hypothetical protein
MINRCKANDNLVFKELYNKYAKSIYNISLRFVNNKYKAEDL